MLEFDIALYVNTLSVPEWTCLEDDAFPADSVVDAEITGVTCGL